MRRTAVLGVAMALLTVACHGSTAGSGAAPQPSAVLAGKPCSASSQGVDVSEWREVSLPDFTYCAPRNWTVGENDVRLGTAVVTWGRGERQGGKLTRRIVVEAAPGVTVPKGMRAPESVSRSFTESIGGQPVHLWRNQLDTQYSTGAEWDAVHLWFAGQANGPSAADVEIAIYRTVRFRDP